jgi:hypothetical protein
MKWLTGGAYGFRKSRAHPADRPPDAHDGGRVRRVRAFVDPRAEREGLALARARGVYTGRKRVLSFEQMAQLGDMIKAGHMKAALARRFGISRESIYTYIR